MKERGKRGALGDGLQVAGGRRRRGRRQGDKRVVGRWRRFVLCPGFLGKEGASHFLDFPAYQTESQQETKVMLWNM